MSRRSRCVGLLLVHFRLRARQHLRAFEVVGDLDQRIRRDDLDVRARPGRFRAAGRRADQALLARIRPDRRRQDAGHGRDRAIEPEFAEHGKAVERIRRDGADRRHQAERDRQIVMAAFLRQIGGREIDGDPPRRQRQPRGDQRRAHPLARLGHRLVGQADDRKRRQAGRDLHLHVDRAGLDPLKGYGRNALNHAAPVPQSKVAGNRRTSQEHYGNRVGLNPTFRHRRSVAKNWTSVDHQVLPCRRHCTRAVQAEEAMPCRRNAGLPISRALRVFRRLPGGQRRRSKTPSVCAQKS